MALRNAHDILHPDLSALIETVNTGTVSAAAKALGISQPALSARLARLRRSTGAPLFRRAGRHLALTSHGARVHDGAVRILRGCEALHASIRGEPDRRMRLRVGTSDAVPKARVRRILLPYLKAGHSISCCEVGVDELERKLMAHELDVLITDRPPSALRDAEDLEVIEAGQSRILLSAPRDLAARLRRDFPACLAKVPLGLPTRPCPLRDSVDRWLNRHRIQTLAAVEADDRALLHYLAEKSGLVVPVAKVSQAEIHRQFRLAAVGELDQVLERYYLVRSRLRVPEIEGGR